MTTNHLATQRPLSQKEVKQLILENRFPGKRSVAHLPKPKYLGSKSVSIMTLTSKGGTKFEVSPCYLNKYLTSYPWAFGAIYLSFQDYKESLENGDIDKGGWCFSCWEDFIKIFPEFSGINPPPTWHECNFGTNTIPYARHYGYYDFSKDKD